MVCCFLSSTLLSVDVREKSYSVNSIPRALCGTEGATENLEASLRYTSWTCKTSWKKPSNKQKLPNKQKNNQTRKRKKLNGKKWLGSRAKKCQRGSQGSNMHLEERHADKRSNLPAPVQSKGFLLQNISSARKVPWVPFRWLPVYMFGYLFIWLVFAPATSSS